MAQKKIYHPGEKSTISGQYNIVDKFGKSIGVERGVNAGERFPPPEKGGQGYILADATKTRAENRQKADRRKKLTGEFLAGNAKGPFDENIILSWMTIIAVLKSVLSIGVGVFFLYTGVVYIKLLIEMTLKMKLFDAALPAMSTMYDTFGGSNMSTQMIAILLTSLSILTILIIVLTPAFLLIVGYQLLTKEVFEKEMDKTGNLILRLRSGLGKVKPIEEMINSIFGRSRSAWDLRLWASRITFFIGVAVFIVAIVQLVIPDIFGGDNQAVFFGAGAGVSVFSMVVSTLLNPAEKLQENIIQNADIELATINYVKQAELIDGWMTRALLSVEKDDDWSPENEVLASLEKNTTILRTALGDSVKVIDATKAASDSGTPVK